MKKLTQLVMILCFIVLLAGCRRDEPSPQTDVNVETPTEEPELPDEEPIDEFFTIEDYFPFLADVEYVYEGEGNEYASYRVFTDFLDLENDRIQTRTYNGGTELVRVIQNIEGKLTVLLAKEEYYHRDNLLDREDFIMEEDEVLLMEPLVMGTEWLLPDNRRRYISGINVEIETPMGSIQALEVTTEGYESVTRQYYGLDMGLVKSEFESNDIIITSTLSEINRNKPYSQNVTFYYASDDETLIPEEVTLTFYTNDITRIIMQEALKEERPNENFIPLISENTTINYMYLGEDDIVYVDFSNEFVAELNVGAGYESLVLQSLVNILGNYYGVEEVYLTVGQKPYESGHILLEEGETLKVNMELVVD